MLFGVYQSSHRAESGVKVVCTEQWGSMSISVDLDDKRTQEILRKRLEVYADYDIVDGKLEKRK
jgi:hypothetical protein